MDTQLRAEEQCYSQRFPHGYCLSKRRGHTRYLPRRSHNVSIVESDDVTAACSVAQVDM